MVEFMRKLWPVILLALSLMLLTSCAGSPGGSASSSAAGASATANTLTTYLQALVDKDEEKVASLICPSWQTDALIEYDAFQAVETRLDGRTCKQSGNEGEAALVTCKGKILAKYVDQTQEFDLSNRTYRLEKNGADWQVCGYTLQ